MKTKTIEAIGKAYQQGFDAGEVSVLPFITELEDQIRCFQKAQNENKFYCSDHEEAHSRKSGCLSCQGEERYD